MKPRFDPRYLPTALLLALAVLLLLVMAAETGWGTRFHLPLPQPQPQKNAITLGALLPEFGLPAEQTYTEMLDRPLFVPTRRPSPPAPVAAPPAPAMRKGQFMLLGVIITKDIKVAMLREVATGKSVRVEQGKEINGMLVEKLEPERVTLSQNGDREELVMKIQATPKTTHMAPTNLPPGMPGLPGMQPAPPPVPQGELPPAQQPPANLQEIIRRRSGG